MSSSEPMREWGEATRTRWHLTEWMRKYKWLGKVEEKQLSRCSLNKLWSQIWTEIGGSRKKVTQEG